MFFICCRIDVKGLYVVMSSSWFKVGEQVCEDGNEKGVGEGGSSW